MRAHTPAWVMGMSSSVPVEEQAGMKKDDGAQCGWSSRAAVLTVPKNPIPLPGSPEAVQPGWPEGVRGATGLVVAVLWWGPGQPLSQHEAHSMGCPALCCQGRAAGICLSYTKWVLGPMLINKVKQQHRPSEPSCQGRHRRKSCSTGHTLWHLIRILSGEDNYYVI